MRVRLKGIHSVPRRLASGEVVIYYYAWRGGPRLKGEPGTPEFLASYQAALAERKQPPRETFKALIEDYKRSTAFTRLAPRTQYDYRRQLTKIEIEFGDAPLAALEDPRITRDFLEWRDRLAETSARQADYGLTVLMRVLNFGRQRGLTAYRPPDRIERLYHADRADLIWTESDVAKFMAVAPITLQWALVLAMDTGQRQGDLLVLPWSAYDGQWIRLRQKKSGRKVEIPVTRQLKAVLDAMPRRGPVILTNAQGRPWRANAFRNAWRRYSRKAGISELTFHDLRGTAVTRLAEAGCTHAEIATITGHSLRDVAAILERYQARTPKLAIAAIAKLERARS